MNTYYINGELKTAAEILADKRMNILKDILENIDNNFLHRDFDSTKEKYVYSSYFGEFSFYFNGEDLFTSFFGEPFEKNENKEEREIIDKIHENYEKIFNISDEIFIKELSNKSLSLFIKSETERQAFYKKILEIIKSLKFIKTNHLAGFFVNENGDKVFYVLTELCSKFRYKNSNYCKIYDMNFVNIFYCDFDDEYRNTCDDSIKRVIVDFVSNCFEEKAQKHDEEREVRKYHSFQTSIDSIMNYKI